MRALSAVGGIQGPYVSLERREIYTEGNVVWEGMQRELKKLLFGGGIYIKQQGFYVHCMDLPQACWRQMNRIRTFLPYDDVKYLC